MSSDRSERVIQFGSVVSIRQGHDKDAPLRRWVVTDVSPLGFTEPVFHAYGVLETPGKPRFWSAATLNDYDVIEIEQTLTPRDVLQGIARGFRLYKYPFRKEYRMSLQSVMDKPPRKLATTGKVRMIPMK